MSATTSVPATTAPTGTSWTLKKIDITITLGEGTFGQTGFNTVKLSGLRTIVTLNKSGAPSQDHAFVRIYGVQDSVMNAVSTLGIPLQMWRMNNAMLIEAGDTINGMAVIYSGYLRTAFQDLAEAPETSLNLEGWGGGGQAIFPVPPLSFPGQFDVATAMQGLAARQGWSFENNGVQVQLPTSYYPGTALKQIHDIARDANIEAYPDTGTNPITLALWPKYGTRAGQIPLISTTSGLIGYPRFQSNGMSFRMLFNPNLKIGGQIKMQSSIGVPARTITSNEATTFRLPPGTQTAGGPNGLWTVISPLTYNLAAQLPNGPWECDVHCARINQPGTA